MRRGQLFSAVLSFYLNTAANGRLIFWKECPNCVLGVSCCAMHERKDPKYSANWLKRHVFQKKNLPTSVPMKCSDEDRVDCKYS